MDRRLRQEKIVKCAICRHDELQEGSATAVLERGDATVIFKRYRISTLGYDSVILLL